MMETKIMVDNIKIAIVGVGSIFSGAHNSADFWREIFLAKDLITEIPSSHWDINDYYDQDPKIQDKIYCRRGSFLPDIEFNPIEWGIRPNIVPYTDTCQLLTLIVAKEVLKDTFKGDFFNTALSRASVIIGATGGLELFYSMAGRVHKPLWIKVMREFGLSESDVTQISDRISSYFTPWQENTFPGLLQNVIAGRVANRLNFGGTNCTTDAACASSLSAISMGINELLLHQSDLVVVGGSDTINDPLTYMCFSKTTALSPTEECRPFSSKADGTILGEGIGLFALKRLEDAEKDGNKIYAVIRGVGSSSDGYEKSIYAPVARGQVTAYERAYTMAGYSPKTVGLIEAHGTGTKAGDSEEFKGMREVFSAADNNHKQWCALGSIKSQIGHSKGAAGAAGLFKITMALHHKVLPPTIKVDVPNPDLHISDSPFYLNTKSRPWIKNSDVPRRASVSSFGFGGTNFHLTVEEYKGPDINKASRINTNTHYLILLSSTNEQLLIQQCQELQNNMNQYGDDYISYAARLSYKEFHAADPIRLGLMVKDGEDVREKIKTIITHLEQKNTQHLINKDIFLMHDTQPGKIAFLFSGQGSQYLNMGADLAMAFEASSLVWDSTTQIPLDPVIQLHEVVFPKPVFSEVELLQQKTLLNNTVWTQPALATTAFSQLTLLNKLGIRADCVGGHSFGELIALAHSGGYDFPTLVKIARKRGELMADSSASEEGGMIAVLSQTIETLLILLEMTNISLVPANLNSPSEVVLSGAKDEIEKAKRIFGQHKIMFVELPVSHAFHSPAMQGAAVRFRDFLNEFSFEQLNIPVYSNCSTTLYENDEQQVKDNLANQLENTVRFSDMIQSMYDSGVRTFIEVGPNSILSNLVHAILPNQEVNAISLDKKGEEGGISFWRALARLSVLGVALDFEQLLHEYETPELPEKIEDKKHYLLINGANKKPTPPKLNVTRQEVVATHLSSNTIIEENPTEFISSIQSDPNKSMDQPVALGGNKVISHSNEKNDSAELISLYAQIQKSVTDTHQEYQKSTAECHQAYLEMVKQTLASLHNMKSDQLPEYQDKQPLSSVAHSLPVANPTVLEPVKINTIQDAPISKKESSLHETLQEPQSAKTAIAQDVPENMHTYIMEIIAKETGYPKEMLRVEMDMEADLGIDSIKRVEILSAILEKFPDLPPMEPSQLGGLKTLEDLANFIKQTAGPMAQLEQPTKEEVIVASPNETPAILKRDLQSDIIEIIAKETGYPIEMLKLEMDMEADLGIDSIKRVEILSAILEKHPDLPPLEPTQLAGLKTLLDLTNFVKKTAGISDQEQNTAGSAIQLKKNNGTKIEMGAINRTAHREKIITWSNTMLPRLKEGNVVVIKDARGVSPLLVKKLFERGITAQEIELTSNKLDTSDCIIYLNGLTEFKSSRDAISHNLEAFELTKKIADKFVLSGGSLVLVQDTGGDFGLASGNTIQAWSSGGVSLARTASLEWPLSLIKTIDINSANLSPENIASRLAEELLLGGSEKEVGIRHDGTRIILEDYQTPYALEQPLVLDDDAVILVSGGGKGITGWCVESLSHHYNKLHFILLGRTVLEKEPEFCDNAFTVSELKQQIYDDAKARNISISPKQMNQEINKILANRDIHHTMDVIKASGSKATYYSVDVLNEQLMTQTLAEIKQRFGAIKGLIHGAGVIHDKMIQEKTKEQFEQVFNPKVQGLSILLDSLIEEPLQLICLFSSIVAHYGNKGQCDYAMANQVMNTVAAAERKRRGDTCLVKSINWGPWDGGMVTADLRKQFEDRGIGLLSRSVGTKLFLSELLHQNPTALVLSNGWQHTTSAENRSDSLEKQSHTFKISPQSHSFLLSHCIKEKPVIPFCLAIEWFIKSVRNKTEHISSIIGHDLKVIKGIRLNELDERHFTVLSTPKSVNSHQEVFMDLKTHDDVLSYSMKAAVYSQPKELNNDSLIRMSNEATFWPWKAEECYGDMTKLFHGEDFYLIKSLDLQEKDTATATIQGVHTLGWQDLDWSTDPGIVDASFQVASLFGQKFFNKISIPMKVSQLVIYQEGLSQEPLECRLQCLSHDNYRAKYNIELVHKNGIKVMEIKGLEMVVMP